MTICRTASSNLPTILKLVPNTSSSRITASQQTAGDTTTLEKHLDGFEENYYTQSQEVVADAGYGSEENYEMMESKAINVYVKYNYFHKEQKRKQKNNPFLVKNLYYNEVDDFYICPMGQKMEHTGSTKGWAVTVTTGQQYIIMKLNDVKVVC